MLQSNQKLKSLIGELWQHFWSGGINNPITAIEQITYLLFMKRLDDLEAKRERDTEFTGEPYKSRFSGEYIPYVDEINMHHGSVTEDEFEDDRRRVEQAKRPRSRKELRWSYFTKLPAEKMLDHVRFNVFPFLKQLNGSTSPFTKSMENAVFVIDKPSLLVEATKKIEQIFREIERDALEGGHSFQDIQGDVYEYLLSEISSSGKNGQFRTPRHIIKLMAELAEPQLGERICDPACGTGGFLLGSYQYILADLVRKQDPSKLQKDEDGFERGALSSAMTEEVKKTLEASFYGYDIDASMVRLGLMNLMMHGIDKPQLSRKDTLSKSFNEDATYDLIMANPPFTGNIDKGDINKSLKLPTTKTELLFLENIYHMLRKGRRAAVIVPQGVLFGAAKAFVETRRMLTERCQLEGVITMPGGVFKPYAGVSTAILLFTKVYDADEKVTEPATKRTWFYKMEGDGYEFNDKRTPIPDNHGDLQDIVIRYRSRNKEANLDRASKCFFIPFEEILENRYNINFDKYETPVPEEIVVKDPKVLLASLSELEKEIQQELKGLEKMLG